MDYYVWGSIGKYTNRTDCNTKAQLIEKIKEEFKNLRSDKVKACNR